MLAKGPSEAGLLRAEHPDHPRWARPASRAGRARWTRSRLVICLCTRHCTGRPEIRKTQRRCEEPQVASDRVNLLVGTGIVGGLSTFSSFAYRAVVLMSAFAASAMVASVYVVSSLLLGYIAVIVGLWLARN